MKRMSKAKPKRGRPPKADKHEGFASFSLPKELEAEVETYRASEGIDSLSNAYRILIRTGLLYVRKVK